MWDPVRAPAWASDFDQQLEQLGLDFQRFDEAWDSVRLVVEAASLAKVDEFYPELINGSGLRLITTDPFPHVPGLAVLCEISDTACEVHAVRLR